MDEYRTNLVMDYLSRLKNSALCVYLYVYLGDYSMAC